MDNAGIAAAVLHIYVGGLVAFSQEKGTLDLIALRGNSFWHHHHHKVGGHRAYLKVRTDDLDLENSKGYEVGGGPGPDQIAEFPLDGLVEVTAPAGTIDLDHSKLAAMAEGSKPICRKESLKEHCSENWPSVGLIRLKNGTAWPDPPAKVTFTCESGSDTIEIAHRVRIDVDVKQGDPYVTFSWPKDKKRLAIVKADATVGVWSLPTKPEKDGHHFIAYSSLVNKAEKPCRCELAPKAYYTKDKNGTWILSVDPVLCPPALVHSPQ